MRENRFEIGLVMAGAVSAGAYTAGVIDFLVQALEEWYQAKNRKDNSVPVHDVAINVIAGASAGGMTGAIFAAMMNEEFAPITFLADRRPTQDEIDKNKLYKSWVEEVDISKMLGDDDLKEKNSKVKSLLDSTVLESIANSAISFSSSHTWRSYLSEPLHLYLTLTNLQGVPYDIQFLGKSGEGYSVSQHTDFMHFMLGRQNEGYKEAEWLDPNDDTHENWNLLKSAALATGAFPGGLAPRRLTRRFVNYDFRSWPIPQRPNNDSGPGECIKMVNIKPSWPAEHNEQYSFLSVDGGVMDNEPLELARRELAGPSGFNPREAEDATRAVIMVDPFPSEKTHSLKDSKELDDYDIIGMFTELFGSLISQSRFKPDELILANSDHVYSRYLIAPTRHVSNAANAQYPLASGFLGGFGGFFSQEFRIHDFQLGRRNCQQFLARYLVIPEEKARLNPVFGEYDDADFGRFSIQENGKSFIPLIPLTGSAREKVTSLPWETLRMQPKDLDRLKGQISDRTKIVIGRLLDQYIDNGFTRKLAKMVARFKRGKIVDSIMKKITEGLEEFDLKS